MIDRPDELASANAVSLRFGAFVALGGCIAIVVGGMRMRVERRPATAAPAGPLKREDGTPARRPVFVTWEVCLVSDAPRGRMRIPFIGAADRAT